MRFKAAEEPRTATRRRPSGTAAVARELERVERIFAAHKWITLSCLASAREYAWEHAREGLAYAAGPEEERLTMAVFAGELLGALASTLAAHPREAARLVQELEAHTGVPGRILAREALRSRELMGLEPADSIALELGLLLIFAPLEGVSLWTLDASSRVACVHEVGEATADSCAPKLARSLLTGAGTEPGPHAELFGLPVKRGDHVLAALVGRAAPRQRNHCRSLMQMALPTLAMAVERDAVLAQNDDTERTLVDAAERRLVRLGFDLHDGPLQDLLLLGEDLRLFNDQLGRVLGGRGQEALLRGRVEDLDARLVALEAALRGISSSSHPTVLLSTPLPTALGNLTDVFTARTGIEPDLTLRGDPSTLTPSQRIALLNIVQEGLNNTREHSDAPNVSIRIAIDETGLRAELVDDGRGFDVESAVVSAARRGRMGLAGAHERARLLGGQCRIDSKPGGPTVITVLLPHWQPLAADSGSGA
jgi:signal transduction histidine kinase